MLSAIFAEFVGTFVFLLVILVVGEPIPITIALLSAIYMFQKIGPGFYNPAIATVFFAKGDIDFVQLLIYIICQVLGGLAALTFWTLAVKKNKK